MSAVFFRLGTNREDVCTRHQLKFANSRETQPVFINQKGGATVSPWKWYHSDATLFNQSGFSGIVNSPSSFGIIKYHSNVYLPRLFTIYRFTVTHLVLYRSGNLEMSIHDAWEDLPLNVTGYCSDNADMEAEVGKLAKSLSDRTVAVNVALKRALVHHQCRFLYHVLSNLQPCIHGIWERWLPIVTGHRSEYDAAAMETVFGKVSKGFH
ncbi:hypothetical protein FPQ18DRAFT_308992 [Pyronema domesticum]|nr:hypothetical protein FPQ18DRAFT_308992 [Pyronema domesticum]